MAYNVSQKLKDNLNAVRIALAFEKEGRQPDPAAVDALKKYAGFGGIKAILYPYGTLEDWKNSGATDNDLKLHKDILQLHELLREHFSDDEYKSVVASLRNSVLTAFYTPEIVPKTLFEVLQSQGIHPQNLYEPAAGSGVFITEAVKAFPDLKQVTAVEKDRLTGLVLTALNSTTGMDTRTHITGFEEAPLSDNGSYDLVASNIPFGNFSVYDPAFTDKQLSGKIHNYFFAKGLDKLTDGGLMAYITTDAFLNSPSNKTAREYLFRHADFISLSVLPDNLMLDTGNTQAPSHLLVVQKHSGKQGFSADEQLLLASDEQHNAYGSYYQNSYIAAHREIILGDEIKAGTNQYGQAHQVVWQHGPMQEMTARLQLGLKKDFGLRYTPSLVKTVISVPDNPSVSRGKKLTLLPMPEDQSFGVSRQLGLFDAFAGENPNRAFAYINQADEQVIRKESVRMVSTIGSADNPGHEHVVLLAARQHKRNQYLYKLHSNVKELDSLSANWMGAGPLAGELQEVSRKLGEFDHSFRYEGDPMMEGYFRFAGKETLPFTAIKPYYKEGTLVVHMGKPGVLGKVDGENHNAPFHPIATSAGSTFYESYVQLRDSYLELSLRETSREEITQAERETLNGQYDRFVSAYGQLNSPANRRQIMEDTAFGLTLPASLERREGERYVKADILTNTLQHIRKQFTTEDPIEALAHSLNDIGRVDMDFIASAMGMDQEEAITRLGNHIYLDPVSNRWETADAYLSGNVVEKLRQAERLAMQAPENGQYRRSMEALEKVQPERIPFDLLDFNLGERWIPIRYYKRFATELFEQDTQVDYFPSLDTFKVSTGMNLKVSREFAVSPKSGRSMYGYTLLEHALENTTPFFTYEIALGNGKAIRVPDNEAIQQAHQKIEQLRENFTSWLRELPDTDKREIENLYNDTFNCYVLREYDGSHLSFPGLDKKALGIEDLYASQKNAVWRILQNRGALIDHEVGLGKTLTMIIAAQEMKRLGILHKPMILALKANVDQVAETYRKAYPHARILAPSEQDFTPDKRIRLFHEIKNNNWDCIIVTHDQFGKIPQSPGVQRQIFEQELENVQRDLDTISELGGSISKKMLKGLEIRKNNLEGQLKTVTQQIEQKKDTGINFGEMGIDHLFVDESHKFKNLTFTTRHSRVAGLGNTQGSQKALNMLFAVRSLQYRFDSDLCVTFLSGTPLSNSLTEMYLIFKYLRPKEMERQHIENFDGWAAVFARKTTDFEFSVTNEIIAKERFRHFIKVPELALFYNEITDYKTAAHIGLDKPQLQEQLVNIPPTPEQALFIKNLMQFAKTGKGELIGRRPLTREEDKGRMLLATNYAKKMSADMRLIDPQKYSDHPGNKVNVAARKIAEIYRESTAHRGTQIVFSDIGTPKPGEFNLYDALKEKLVRDFGIPSGEITFIHNWNERRKPELFRKMNRGEIRILLGSTEKAGTGLNVQARVVAMHHLDIPWKPSELEQRGGRGARQGNTLAKQHYGNKVRNYIYAVEQSLDNYKFNLLSNKQTFISQMKNCELNVRTIDEGAVDEKSGMNFSEYIAILSGDTSLLEKSKLEKKVAVLESLKVSHFREDSRLRYQLENLQNERASAAGTLEKLNADQKVYSGKLQWRDDGVKDNPIELIGLRVTESGAIGRHIIDLYENWKPSQAGEDTQRVGSLYGFNLYIRRQREAFQDTGGTEYSFSNRFYAQREDDGIRYTYNNGIPNTDNPKLAARHFLNTIDRVESLKEKYGRELEKLDGEIPKLEKLTAKAFTREEELQELKTRLSGLEREIAIKIQENQLKQQQEEGHGDDRDETVEISREPVQETVRADKPEPVILTMRPDNNQEKMYASMRRNRRMKL